MLAIVVNYDKNVTELKVICIPEQTCHCHVSLTCFSNAQNSLKSSVVVYRFYIFNEGLLFTHKLSQVKWVYKMDGGMFLFIISQLLDYRSYMAINHSAGFSEGLSPAGKDAYSDLNLCSCVHALCPDALQILHTYVCAC